MEARVAGDCLAMLLPETSLCWGNAAENGDSSIFLLLLRDDDGRWSASLGHESKWADYEILAKRSCLFMRGEGQVAVRVSIVI